jgi:hypothetical protein
MVIDMVGNSLEVYQSSDTIDVQINNFIPPQVSALALLIQPLRG